VKPASRGPPALLASSLGSIWKLRSTRPPHGGGEAGGRGGGARASGRPAVAAETRGQISSESFAAGRVKRARYIAARRSAFSDDGATPKSEQRRQSPTSNELSIFFRRSIAFDEPRWRPASHRHRCDRQQRTSRRGERKRIDRACVDEVCWTRRVETAIYYEPMKAASLLPDWFCREKSRSVNRSTRFGVTSQFGQVWPEKPNATRIIGEWRGLGDISEYPGADTAARWNPFQRITRSAASSSTSQ